MKDSRKKYLKLAPWIISGLIFLYLFTIPWRNYVYRKNLSDGKNLLSERKYTEAYVKFEKAAILKPLSSEPQDMQNLAKKSAADILALRDFLVDNNNGDLLPLIDSADSKVCNLENDRTLINNDLAQVAAVNLKFCAEEGPKNYDSWIFYAVSQLKISENKYIFKELKPDFRLEAKRAFEEAYKVDPVAKTAPQYLVELYKTDNNSEKVDYWTKILNDLNKIGE